MQYRCLSLLYDHCQRWRADAAFSHIARAPASCHILMLPSLPSTASLVQSPGLSSCVLVVDSASRQACSSASCCSHVTTYVLTRRKVRRAVFLKASLTASQVTQSDQIELPDSREAAVSLSRLCRVTLADCEPIEPICNASIQVQQACKAALGNLPGVAASKARKVYLA